MTCAAPWWTIMAEQGADIAVLDSLLNRAASGPRGGIVAQKATLVEPMRKLMVLCDDLLTKALERGKRL
jgi:hypothetical protein